LPVIPVYKVVDAKKKNWKENFRPKIMPETVCIFDSWVRVNEPSFAAAFSSDSDSSTWVTVFGFPPSAASYILSQFSQCGTILQHHMPANGNWMHIKYQTRSGF
jgi:hypothetical protein